MEMPHKIISFIIFRHHHRSFRFIFTFSFLNVPHTRIEYVNKGSTFELVALMHESLTRDTRSAHAHVHLNVNFGWFLR